MLFFMPSDKTTSTKRQNQGQNRATKEKDKIKSPSDNYCCKMAHNSYQGKPRLILQKENKG